MSDDTEVQQTVEAPDPAIEAEARQGGWVPKEQFRGREEEWADAETFVKRGREINPILRKHNERLQKELNEAKGQLNELQLTTKEFAAEFAKMKENAYKRAISELKEQRREALKDDDHATVDDLEERIEELKEQQKTAVKKPELAKPSEPDMTEFREWQKDNSWYDEKKDPELFDMTEVQALRLRRTEPELKGREFLDRLAEVVKKKMPEKFENPRREKAPHDGGSRRGVVNGGKTYNNLPPDAKTACDKFVKQGILTKEQYVESYDWS